MTGIIEPDELDKVIKEGAFSGLSADKEERERRERLVKFYDDGFV